MAASGRGLWLKMKVKMAPDGKMDSYRFDEKRRGFEVHVESNIFMPMALSIFARSAVVTG